MSSHKRQTGSTLIELVISVAIAALLLTGLQQLLSTGLTTKELAEQKTDLARQGRFAMSRMVHAARGSQRLLIPLADNPATAYAENFRAQSVPASPPQSGSVLDTAVLAVTLRTDQDMDANGIFDGDNDGDGLFDEDLPADAHNDGVPGIRGVDDDGDGDESSDYAESDDAINLLDDDGDGRIGEDWYDPVVFYLNGSTLVERRAVPWDENSDGSTDGQDYVESSIADKVTLLQFERIPAALGQAQEVEITLALGSAEESSVSLNTRVRIGAVHE